MPIEIKKVEHLHYELETHQLDKIRREIEEIKNKLNTLLEVNVHISNLLKKEAMEKAAEDRIAVLNLNNYSPFPKNNLHDGEKNE